MTVETFLCNRIARKFEFPPILYGRHMSVYGPNFARDCIGTMMLLASSGLCTWGRTPRQLTETDDWPTRGICRSQTRPVGHFVEYSLAEGRFSSHRGYAQAVCGGVTSLGRMDRPYATSSR
eukprot:7191188-Pyramimonas_sp.AAC.1